MPEKNIANRIVFFFTPVIIAFSVEPLFEGQPLIFPWKLALPMYTVSGK